MADKTKIEWSDATWNPTKGCDRVSAGCDHCYAMTLAPRLKAMGSPAYQFDGDPRTSGLGFLAHEWAASLDQPLRWKKPRRIFVNSMSDLFHERISDEYIAQVFAVMAAAPRHTFQILTKRHARMRSLLTSARWAELLTDATEWPTGADIDPERPLDNVWLGVSVEDQKWADIRIRVLLETPTAVRFLSCEPLLGPVDLTVAFAQDHPVDWVIVGGESGAGARPMRSDWARSLRDQCVAAGVPFLFKQWGSHDADGKPAQKHTAGRDLDGRTWDQYPHALTRDSDQWQEGDR